MGPPKTPRTDALFGIFLQDMGEIRQKHPRSFGSKYYTFDYAVGTEEGYRVLVEPDTFPRAVKREIIQAFDRRLNQDLLPVIGEIRRKRKAVKP
ncbi:MAG TPA: hypothetical protein VL832_04815 [Puia sp.]|nr:hypothetical protein [Puia sp.]